VDLTCQYNVDDPPTATGEGGKDRSGSIMLYYQSVRGSVLAPMVVGMVREVARTFFSTAVTFERILTQGVDR
jgi:hypothetical protein